MKRVIISITLLLFLGCSNDIKPESYDAGFKIIHSVDQSRIYKPNTDTTNYLHYRPLDIDVWYPAQATATDSTLLFRDLLGLLATRANYYTASDAGNGMTQQIAQYMCTQLKCSDTTKVLNFKTHTFKDAPPANSKFPLVIYLCSYNGMSFENYLLFEKLAEKGFVVASISSIGRYPGDMTMKYGDLMQQVDDAIASLKNFQQTGKSLKLTQPDTEISAAFPL